MCAKHVWFMYDSFIVFCTGQLVWRRHTHLPLPPRRVIRSTCVQLLPLVEMYLKWEFEEDCTNLRALMLRFDSETELESYELGRSLLFMVRDDGAELENLPRPSPLPMPANPFDVVRERLAAAGSAIQGLHHKVHIVSYLCCAFGIACQFLSSLNMTFSKTQPYTYDELFSHSHACATIWHPFQVEKPARTHSLRHVEVHKYITLTFRIRKQLHMLSCGQQEPHRSVSYLSFK